MKEVKNITIEKKIAERFQQFSRTHYKTHSEAMAGMLDFFFTTRFLPKKILDLPAGELKILLRGGSMQ
ncbi:hypothetical protein LDL76_08970 [Salegentibacter mishustinae]|nr:BfmA/BtgA family mobilization protein [Salegentibacter mishustinae]UBZ05505.1 hypothetical protein LDL76_08970 [Salegentibacter mishustinae]